jgi:hypothetical protein
MRMPDDPAPGDHNDHYIASILRSEGTTFRLDQAVLFTTCDALGHQTLEKAISRTRQIDHGLASDFDEQSGLTRAMPCSMPLARSLNVAPTTI